MAKNAKSTASKTATPKLAIIIPTWNRRDELADCLAALTEQTTPHDVFVVENASSDGTADMIAKKFPNVTVLQQEENLGFAGGVNKGLVHALSKDYDYCALLNNDALPDKNWLKFLCARLDNNPKVAIAAARIVRLNSDRIDSTGEMFSTWGMPFPRSRDRHDTPELQAELSEDIFGASGGASLYRSEALRQIGLFSEDYFAYFEDVDISFRARLAGWNVQYERKAIVRHAIGGTSAKIPGFTVYQTFKNMPALVIRCVPSKLLWVMLPRFIFAYTLLLGSAIAKGRGWHAIKGFLAGLWLLPKKLRERKEIQASRTVAVSTIRKQMHAGAPAGTRGLVLLEQNIKRLLKRPS